jgi:hypothetical protein
LPVPVGSEKAGPETPWSGGEGPAAPAPIHATNAWNPTGRNLSPIPGTRLFYVHAESLGAPRTFVLLGDQRHLTFVGDFKGHVAPEDLRSLVLERSRLYPHQVDLDRRPGFPPGSSDPSPSDATG